VPRDVVLGDAIRRATAGAPAARAHLEENHANLLDAFSGASMRSPRIARRRPMRTRRVLHDEETQGRFDKTRIEARREFCVDLRA
jgi:hypothetical protein